jgi:hypothetical protein
MVVVALVLNGIANLNFSNYPRIPKKIYWTKWIMRLGLPALFAIYAILLANESRVYLQSKYQRGLNRRSSKTQIALEWIRTNTSEDAVFLIDPLMNEFFTYANRARFVSFIHSPQSAEDILEWYDRLTLINGMQEPRIPVARGELQENFYNLEAESIHE